MIVGCLLRGPLDRYSSFHWVIHRQKGILRNCCFRASLDVDHHRRVGRELWEGREVDIAGLLHWDGIVLRIFGQCGWRKNAK